MRQPATGHIGHDYPRIYEGRVAAVEGRAFSIAREQATYQVPAHLKMPAVGQYVTVTTSKSGTVTALSIRSRLRDRIIQSHQEAGLV